MRKLEVEIPDTLWHTLQQYAERSGLSVDDVICRALTDHINDASISRRTSNSIDEDDTIFQASTATALVEGVYRGAVNVRTLRQKGDLGIGTFEDLDGEMIIVDGSCYQALSDGSVRPVNDDVLTPYAVVAKFGAEKAIEFDCSNLAELQKHCDTLRHSENLFYAIKVTGLFDEVDVRVVCKTADGIPLVDAVARQKEFKFQDVAGTLVGFWSPQFAKTLDVPGYHLHFLSADRSRGGHLLDCRGKRLKMEIDPEANLSVILPTNRSFLDADLSKDPSAALHRAETKPQSGEQEQ